MDAAHAAPSSTLPPLFQWWRTPLLALVVYCLISIGLKENYPFSHYPMYANPSADRSYYVVADAETGQPLPIATVSGITCPKIGKMYRTKVEAMASKAKVSKKELSPEQTQEIGLDIFQQLREYARQSNLTGLPPKLMLQRVDILWKDEAMTEKPTTLAKE